MRFAGIVMMAAALVLLPSCTARSMELRQNEVRTRISQVLKLHTAEYGYRDVIHLDEQTRMLGIFPSAGKKLLFSVRISIRAGIDLSRGYQIEMTGPRRVRIVLPRAEILAADAEEDSIHQYFAYQNNSRISLLEIQDIVKTSKTSLTEDAVRRGILNEAETQAAALITQLCESMNLIPEIAFGGALQ